MQLHEKKNRHRFTTYNRYNILFRLSLFNVSCKRERTLPGRNKKPFKYLCIYFLQHEYIRSLLLYRLIKLKDLVGGFIIFLLFFLNHQILLRGISPVKKFSGKWPPLGSSLCFILPWIFLPPNIADTFLFYPFEKRLFLVRHWLIIITTSTLCSCFFAFSFIEIVFL